MHIDQTNAESFLLSYIDGELTAAERREVEVYCQANPEAAAELQWLKQTVLVSPLTVFDAKDSLYRGEEKRRVIAWYGWRAAALIVLLAGAVSYWYLRPASPGKENGYQTAGVNTRAKAMADSGDGNKGKDSMTALRVETIAGPAVSATAAGPGLPAAAKNIPGSEENGTENAAAKKAFVKLFPGIKSPAGRKAEHVENNKGISDAAGENRAADSSVEDAVGKETADDAGNSGSTALARHLNVRTVTLTAGSTGMSKPPVTNSAEKNLVVAVPGDKQPVDVAENPDRIAEETAAANGNDAVSILRLANNKVRINKLFRRLSGERNNDIPTGNSGGKKVNISVFQFALGK